MYTYHITYIHLQQTILSYCCCCLWLAWTRYCPPAFWQCRWLDIFELWFTSSFWQLKKLSLLILTPSSWKMLHSSELQMLIFLDEMSRKRLKDLCSDEMKQEKLCQFVYSFFPIGIHIFSSFAFGTSLDLFFNILFKK